MQLTMLKSKIHRAKVTDSHLDYNGSITIDEDLMEKANNRTRKGPSRKSCKRRTI